VSFGKKGVVSIYTSLAHALVLSFEEKQEIWLIEVEMGVNIYNRIEKKKTTKSLNRFSILNISSPAE
jgi:hypothetical protein